MTKFYSLKDVSVELFLSVAQKLSNHLAAESLSLQEKMSHSNRGVWDKAPFNEILDPFFRFPTGTEKVINSMGMHCNWN